MRVEQYNINRQSSLVVGQEGKTKSLVEIMINSNFKFVQGSLPLDGTRGWSDVEAKVTALIANLKVPPTVDIDSRPLPNTTAN